MASTIAVGYDVTVAIVAAAAYSVQDKDGPVDELRVGSLARITSALDGDTISVVTESGKVFRFGQ